MCADDRGWTALPVRRVQRAGHQVRSFKSQLHPGRCRPQRLRRLPAAAQGRRDRAASDAVRDGVGAAHHHRDPSGESATGQSPPPRPGQERPVIERLAIVGVGLLGGSVAKAVRARGAAREIVGVGRDLARLQPAVADVVILGATVLANDALLPAVWAAVPPGACITDVGSTKRSIVREAERLAAERGDVHFVGSHPMAGAEKSGYAVTRADLFERATVVVTPTKQGAEAATDTVTGLWRTLGARVVVWDAEAHDRGVAAISHLPHVVAWALVDAVDRYEPAALDIVAGGFRDTTRIAAADPTVWREILLANRDEVAVSLGAFREALADLERLITVADPAALETYLARVKALRLAVR